MGNKNKSIYLIPVMLCFFCMGFVDLVGIASNYVKEDLGLTDSVANVFPRWCSSGSSSSPYLRVC